MSNNPGAGSGSGSEPDTIAKRVSAENTRYKAKYFAGDDAKKDFYELIGANRSDAPWDVVKDKLAPKCSGDIEKWKAYTAWTFYKYKVPLIIIVTTSIETDIVAFAFFKHLTDKTIELTLICSSVPGLGGYILDKMEIPIQTLGYSEIQLSAATSQLGLTYNRRGFDFSRMDDDGLAVMVKKISSEDPLPEDREVTEDGTYTTRFGRTLTKPIKYSPPPIMAKKTTPRTTRTFTGLKGDPKKLKESRNETLRKEGGRKSRKNGFRRRKTMRRRR